MLRVKIRNFKSVGDAKVELYPLTILLGPPAGGKSNVMDAIALAGYFNRLLLLDEEYDGNASNLEPLDTVVRFREYEDLFRYHDLGKTISINVAGEGVELKLNIQFSGGKLRISINGIDLPWDLRPPSLPLDPLFEVREALKLAAKDKLVEARLYGYDRYGLALPSCVSPTNCGFYLRLRGEEAHEVPKNILSELGWNAQRLIRRVPDIKIRLNNALTEDFNEKIEIHTLRSGAIVVFDYGDEVNPLTVSDSIFRALYYLMALRTAVNYIKIHGLEGKLILLLEEPEAHIFPFLTHLLAEQVSETAGVAYVVITTHNPILASALWDKVSDVKTYYVTRDEKGSTRLTGIDIKRMAEDLVTIEDLLFMTPKEVIRKYSSGNIELAKEPGVRG